MDIGIRLRTLREAKGLSQGDIERRTGLIRCYVSRVENGHTVPAIETLEKFARALEVPLYQLFYNGEEPPAPLVVPNRRDTRSKLWGTSRKDARLLSQFRRCLGRLQDQDRKLLLLMAQRMGQSKNRSKTASGG
jgi:transcriptional regulator with XRE-family HTH domain